MNRIAICLVIICLLPGCKSGTLNIPNQNATGSVRYAGGFSLTNGRNITVTVRNPWQHAKDVTFTYVLSDTLKTSQRINESTWHIKTPVKNVICLSTTHIGFINFLNRIESISGISGREYVVNNRLRTALSQNRVFDVGYDENLDIELILKLKPDVVFAYGVNASVTKTINKLAELDIPVVLIGEYLEQHPLAKMEWVKVFASCYGMNTRATEQFDSVVNRYNTLVALSEKSGIKPSVLLGLPWRGTWYISGSKSYMAQLVKDAGARYIFDHFDFNESRPIGLEKIYESALAAEYWINPGEARSVNDILAVDERFGTLPSIVNEKVFNNDRFMVAGGNAIYEAGVVEPDIILADLLSILNPQLLPSHNLKYYRKLQ